MKLLAVRLQCGKVQSRVVVQSTLQTVLLWNSALQLYHPSSYPSINPPSNRFSFAGPNLSIYRFSTLAALWMCPGTSPDTGTPFNFCLQLGLEPRTFHLSPVPYRLSYHHPRATTTPELPLCIQQTEMYKFSCANVTVTICVCFWPEGSTIRWPHVYLMLLPVTLVQGVLHPCCSHKIIPDPFFKKSDGHLFTMNTYLNKTDLNSFVKRWVF